MRLTPTMVSSPGLTGRSSNHRPGILDRPVKPGDDTGRVNSIRPHRALHGRAPHQPALVGRKIVARMGRAAIVPNQKITDAPYVAIDEFLPLGMVEHRVE